MRIAWFMKQFPTYSECNNKTSQFTEEKEDVHMNNLENS